MNKLSATSSLSVAQAQGFYYLEKWQQTSLYFLDENNYYQLSIFTVYIISTLKVKYAKDMLYPKVKMWMN